MNDWLISFAMPIIVIGFLAAGGGLLLVYLATRCVVSLLSTADGTRAVTYFGYLWMGSLLAIDGYLVSEFGYQVNFWEAPGIWGSPGKASTVWGQLAYILPPLGFVLGASLNAVLDQSGARRAQVARIGLTILSSVFFILTALMAAKHGFETLG